MSLHRLSQARAISADRMHNQVGDSVSRGFAEPLFGCRKNGADGVPLVQQSLGYCVAAFRFNNGDEIRQDG